MFHCLCKRCLLICVHVLCTWLKLLSRKCTNASIFFSFFLFVFASIFLLNLEWVFEQLWIFMPHLGLLSHIYVFFMLKTIFSILMRKWFMSGGNLRVTSNQIWIKEVILLLSRCLPLMSLDHCIWGMQCS